MKLKECPECGSLSKISSLDKKYKSHKYFCSGCSAHISCGDWKNTKKSAGEDWNRRVEKYIEYQEKVHTVGTKEWIERQGIYNNHAYCDNCEYSTETMNLKDLIFKICMEGGYIMADKEGGYYSQCPKCEGSNLSIYN